MALPAEQLALRIVRQLQAAGHVAYWAGGCVRDRLMGRVPMDFDVVTSATPQQVLGLYPRAQQVGVAFGVVLVTQRQRIADGASPGTADRLQVEVATFRAEGDYSDGRHPETVRFTGPQEDARRRDFTCNGLFFDPLARGGQGELHDYVGGRADIEARVLRAIGDPFARFAEDHLRMLRAVRFAARLGFAIEPATFQAMGALAGHIRDISTERVRDELAMILTHESPAARVEAAELLQRSGLLAHIWPEALFEQPQTQRRWNALARLEGPIDLAMALAALQLDLSCAEGVCLERHPPVAPGLLAESRGATVGGLLREALLLSNADTADLAWMLDRLADLLHWDVLSKARFKRLIADPRWPRLAGLFQVAVASQERLAAFESRVAALSAEGAAPAPFITGDSLIALGARPGPNFKKWLDMLYNRQLEGELRTAEEAQAAARALIRTQ